MAADKKDEKPNKDDNAQEGADEAKQKKKKLMLIIGLAVLLVAISVGATFFIVSKMMAGKHVDDSEASSSSEAAEVVVAPAIYYPLTPNFTVNFDVNGRQRFLQAELTFMYRDVAVLKTLELHMPALRNSIVMLLSSQVFDELQTPEGKEKLRAAILTSIQQIVEKEVTASAEKDKEEKDDDHKEAKAKPAIANIEQVLFTQFVMQ